MIYVATDYDLDNPIVCGCVADTHEEAFSLMRSHLITVTYEYCEAQYPLRATLLATGRIEVQEIDTGELVGLYQMERILTFTKEAQT